MKQLNTKYKNNRTERETNYSLSGDYNTETGTNTHELQSELRLPKYGSQSETTRITWLQLRTASGSQA
jgi:hypothetical protein